ncbi:hypothetical protein ACIQ6V_33675 [Streptomyces sp. NPDC096198]|uniref:hypothetical protein n=1 Tax=Streptomyces sp. NPDC096198 TaxID=3366080 RepID=UPI0038103020
MKKILSSPESPIFLKGRGMEEDKAANALIGLHRQIVKYFYSGKSRDFKAYSDDSDGTIVKPVLIVAEQGGSNAALTFLDDGMGVEIGYPLLTREEASDMHVKFAMAHELGHAFSLRLANLINMPGLSGPRMEVIADLGAVFALIKSGEQWGDIMSAVRSGERIIFDSRWNGDHPPAADRVEYIKGLESKSLSNVESFTEQVQRIIRKVPINPF